MISLGGDSLSGRLFKGSILLEGFMVRFHVPSLTIDSGDLVEGQGRIAGHRILNARPAIMLILPNWRTAFLFAVLFITVEFLSL